MKTRTSPIRGKEFAERKFIGVYEDGQIDIISVNAERSKPFSAISVFLEEKFGFTVARESETPPQKEKGDQKREAANLDCKIEPQESFPYTPQIAASSYPLKESRL